MEWIYSHYIQLELLQGFSGVDCVVNYTFPDAPEAVCPWVDVLHAGREEVSASLVPWLQEQLQNGYYVYLFLNTYHLPGYHTYHERHYAHDPLIVGYDSDAGTFAVRDFHRNAQGIIKYGTFEVDSTQLELSFADTSEEMDRLGGVQLLLFNPEADYRFDAKLVQRSLKDYLEGSCTYAKRPNWLSTPVKAYGSKLYAYIKNHLHAVEEGTAEADFRLIHVLHDHKTLMRDRLAFMAQEKLIPGFLAAGYDEVAQDSLLLRGSALKYYLTQNTKLLQQARHVLSALISKEHQVLSAVADELDG